jgi:hypothetical protein
MSFYTGTQAETLYTLPAAVTKNTYTTQACMSALVATNPVATIPAGYFSSSPNGVGRPLLLKAMGTIATTSAATFAGAVAVDTTANTALNPITTFTTVAPTAAVTAQWELEAWITCQAVGTTAGTTLQVNGRWQQSIVATGGALQSTSPWNAMFAGNLTALASNVPLFVELFGTWSVSAAGNTTTVQQMFLLGLN